MQTEDKGVSVQGETENLGKHMHRMFYHLSCQIREARLRQTASEIEEMVWRTERARSQTCLLCEEQ